jgi:hypothetical protein
MVAVPDLEMAKRPRSVTKSMKMFFFCGGGDEGVVVVMVMVY